MMPREWWKLVISYLRWSQILESPWLRGTRWFTLWGIAVLIFSFWQGYDLYKTQKQELILKVKLNSEHWEKLMKISPKNRSRNCLKLYLLNFLFLWPWNHLTRTQQKKAFFETFIPLFVYQFPVGYLKLKWHLVTLIKLTLSQEKYWLGLLVVTLVIILIYLLILWIAGIKHQMAMVQKDLDLRRKITQHILHDLKSPLTLLKLLVQKSHEIDPMEWRGHLSRIDERLTMILQELSWDSPTEQKTSHWDGKINEVKTNLSRLVDILNNLKFQLEPEYNQHIEIQVESYAHFSSFISMPETAILRVLQNLLTNALEANLVTNENIVHVTVITQPYQCSVKIIDLGPGFKSAFDDLPFIQSSKGPRRGLGLQMIYETLKTFGGWVQFTPTWPKGTQAELSLPVWVPSGQVLPTLNENDVATTFDKKFSSGPLLGSQL